MTSSIDPTKPVDGLPANKADLRANLLAAKTEIEALQVPSYVVINAEPTLANERRLSTGLGLALSDSGPGGTVSVNTTGLLFAYAGTSGTGYVKKTGSTSVATRSLDEQSGFDNRTDSTISFDDGTRTFTLTPVGTCGVQILATRLDFTVAKTIQISNTEGIHFIYIDSSGNLNEVTTFDDTVLLRDNAYVSALYWDATNSKCIYLGDERHGWEMDYATHIHLHRAYGTEWITGLALGDIIADASGALNTHAELSYSGGQIDDEDIHYTLTSATAPAQIPMYYLSGASANWRRVDADNFPCVDGATTGFTRLAYNQFTAGAWQLTEVPNGDFVLTHIFATTNQLSPVVGIVGQSTYTSVALARAGAITEIGALVTGTLGGLFQEFTPIGTVIFQTQTSYGNTPKARIRTTDTGANYVDWRSANIVGSTSTTDHGNLAGLGDDDHTQYVHISTNRTISATHTFNPGSAGPAFTLGANATGQLITGLNADLLDGLNTASTSTVSTVMTRDASANTAVNQLTAATVVINQAAPRIALQESDGSADNKNWNIDINAEQFKISLANNAYSTVNDILKISRNTTTPVTFEFFADTAVQIKRFTSGVNYLQLAGTATTFFPAISTRGSDTNVGLGIDTQGTGYVIFTGGSFTSINFRVDNPASSVNYLAVAGSASTTPAINATGTGTNIDVVVNPKGTGQLKQGISPVKIVGIRQLWVPAKDIIPSTTSGCAALANLETTTNLNMVPYLAFDSTNVENAYINIVFPKSWNAGTITAQFYWTHPATTTNFGVVWGIAGAAISDAETLDTAVGSRVDTADTGGTTHTLYITSVSSNITITSSPAAGTFNTMRISRRPADGNDTLAVDAWLIGVMINYTESAQTDA